MRRIDRVAASTFIIVLVGLCTGCGTSSVVASSPVRSKPAGLPGTRGSTAPKASTPSATAPTSDPTTSVVSGVPAPSAAGQHCPDGPVGARVPGAAPGVNWQACLVMGDVSNADLSHSNLWNASSGTHADFDGANMSYSNLGGAGIGPTAVGANFTGADATGLNGHGTNFSNANFTDTNLTNADLGGANLTGATVAGAVWSNTICPDETDSDSSGGTCEGHLSAS